MPNNNNSSTETTSLVEVPPGGPGIARVAYDKKDADASRQYHDIKSGSEEGHQAEGGYLKPGKCQVAVECIGCFLPSTVVMWAEENREGS